MERGRAEAVDQVEPPPQEVREWVTELELELALALEHWAPPAEAGERQEAPAPQALPAPDGARIRLPSFPQRNCRLHRTSR